MFLEFNFGIALAVLLGAVSARVPRREASVMRYLKPSLVGLVGGLLLAASVLTVEFIRAQGVVASQLANCGDTTAGGFVCSGSAQVGSVEALIAFALGFAAAMTWLRRRQQRRVAHNADCDR